MKPETFKQLVEARIKHFTDILFNTKKEEYTRGNDRLHNFKIAAAIDQETPERSLWGMLKKHIVSVRDIVFDIELNDTIPDQKTIHDKFDDWHNYMFLLEALIAERRESQTKLTEARVTFGKSISGTTDDKMM